jgi:trehalose 6-phosphate synthase/phosphatase
MQIDSNLILISNRLPATVKSTPDGLHVRPSSGGLVTALRPVLAAQKGAWIGSIDSSSTSSESPLELPANGNTAETSYDMIGIPLTPAEQHGFYAGFSNEIVWPLFHDLQSRCNFDPNYWAIYSSVNRKFADTIAHVSQSNSRIWVHDYHLMLTGKFLRERGLHNRMGFFLHIPFPSLDIFEKLPWRKQILHALFEFNVIGFQTPRDQRNFLGCVRRLLPDMDLQRVDTNIYRSAGRGTVRSASFPLASTSTSLPGSPKSRLCLRAGNRFAATCAASRSCSESTGWITPKASRIV